MAISESDPFYSLYSFGWSLETPILLVGAFLSLYGLARFLPLLEQRLFARLSNPGLGLVRVAIVFAGAWFSFILMHGAAHDITGLYYVALYVFLAFACLLWGSFVRPILGVYQRGDVVERGNLAAGVMYFGFVLGVAFAFGGALTGEGPGWWVVAFFFFLAYWELRGAMKLVSEVSGDLAREVRVERDVSAGVLLAAVAASAGLIAGRAAAGDFHGWETDLPDYFRRLWGLPLVPLAAVVVGWISDRTGRKTALRTATAIALVAFGVFIYFRA